LTKIQGRYCSTGTSSIVKVPEVKVEITTVRYLDRIETTKSKATVIITRQDLSEAEIQTRNAELWETLGEPRMRTQSTEIIFDAQP